MFNVKSDDFNVIFDNLYSKLKRQRIIVVRGLKTKELVDVHIELLNPFNCVLKCNDVKYYRYLINECFVYLSGSLNAADFIKLSSFWDSCKDDDNTINSNYGYMAFYLRTPDNISQFEWCARELIKDIHSRKSVINFNDVLNKYHDNKDMVCTMFMQFLVRNDALDCYVFMRSNDLIYGLRYDLVFFCLIHILMFIKLKNYYNYLKIGSYFHYDTSLHIYEKHF